MIGDAVPFALMLYQTTRHTCHQHVSTLSKSSQNSFTSWSLSFYPQAILNIRRRSTSGTTPSFPILNILGFACYTASVCSFYFSSTIQEQYRQRNSGQENTVQANDVAFAVHALVLSCVILSQFWPALWGFEGSVGVFRRVGKGVWIIVGGSLVWIVWVLERVIANGGAGPWEWIDLVSLISFML